MNLERIGHLSQIFSGVILILGIGLVIVELRQAKQLARAQLISDSFAIQADRLVAQLGENSAAIIAKACQGSEPLTREVSAVLSTKYQLHNLIAFRSWLLSELFEFEEATWRDTAATQFLYVFRNQHGRAWW